MARRQWTRQLNGVEGQDVERVLQAELAMLAELMGARSSAAKVLQIVQEAGNPQVFRDGRHLLIVDLVGDTAAFGPGHFIELQQRLGPQCPPTSGQDGSRPPRRAPSSRLASPDVAPPPPVR